GVIGWVLLVTMVFFSSLAFTVLQNAMSVIFLHRVAIRRRHFLISAIIPYCYIVFLGLGLLLVTLVSGSLQVIGAESIDFLGRAWSLRSLRRAALLLGGHRRDIGPHVNLSRHASGTSNMAACADRGHYGDRAAGA